MSRVRLVPLALLVAALTLVGCTKNPNAPAQFSGSVSYKGQRLKGGTLTLHAKEGGIYPLPIHEDGTVSMSDLPAQEMVVTVETESENPDKKAPEYGAGMKGKFKGTQTPYMPKGAPEKPDQAAAKKAAYTKIPSKYNDPKTSGLSVTLSRGQNTKDFDLTD